MVVVLEPSPERAEAVVMQAIGRPRLLCLLHPLINQVRNGRFRISFFTVIFLRSGWFLTPRPRPVHFLQRRHAFRSIAM